LSAPQSLIVEVLPRFDASEVHDVWVPARPQVVFAAVKRVTVREALGRHEPRFGSGAIRKSWLAAIRRRAVRAELGGPGA
jgi:hypothetical protein